VPAISQKDEERTLEYVHLAYAAWQPELFVRIDPVPDLTHVEARGSVVTPLVITAKS
jgi:hypothetical protein